MLSYDFTMPGVVVVVVVAASRMILRVATSSFKAPYITRMSFLVMYDK